MHETAHELGFASTADSRYFSSCFLIISQPRRLGLPDRILPPKTHIGKHSLDHLWISLVLTQPLSIHDLRNLRTRVTTPILYSSDCDPESWLQPSTTWAAKERNNIKISNRLLPTHPSNRNITNHSLLHNHGHDSRTKIHPIPAHHHLRIRHMLPNLRSNNFKLTLRYHSLDSSSNNNNNSTLQKAIKVRQHRISHLPRNSPTAI